MAARAETDMEQYREILATASKLPSNLRLSLVQAILRTLEPDVGSSKRMPMPAAEATGILAGSWPTPSDEDVERMVDEYLTEKYQ